MAVGDSAWFAGQVSGFLLVDAPSGGGASILFDPAVAEGVLHSLRGGNHSVVMCRGEFWIIRQKILAKIEKLAENPHTTSTFFLQILPK